MKIVHGLSKWSDFRLSINENQRIGFIPTMGALHKGHISLVEKSIDENEITIVSIFINPTQFNDKNDLKTYPKKVENDINMLSSLNITYLLLPSEDEMYKDGYNYKITEKNLSFKMEGLEREGHFDGVLTVVMKLFNIVNPTCAYFGEKDYQQLRLIENMAESFFMRIKIIPCKTIRSEDGLALSSRNSFLTVDERLIAPKFHDALKSKKSIREIKKQLNNDGFKIEYIEEYDGRLFGAVKIGNVRLIDNEKI